MTQDAHTDPDAGRAGPAQERSHECAHELVLERVLDAPRAAGPAIGHARCTGALKP